MDSGKRFPSLDGLRGLSILLVLIGHAGRTTFPVRLQWILAPLANIGVTLFFALSGFLITTLLLGERTKTGSISLRRFYLRRVLRILPASYAYVAVVAGLAALGLIVLRPHDISCALLYVVDYHPNRSWYLGHYWSLSVEEQFYLLWPPILVGVGTRRAPTVALALVLLALAELVPAVALRLFPTWNPAIRLPSGTAPILIGCLLALGFDRLKRSPFWTSPWWVVAFIAASAAQVYFQSGDRVVHGLQFLIDLLAAAVILRSLLRPDDVAGVILNARPLVTLGTLSYSIYIWQQLFLVDGPAWHHLPFPIDVVAALGVATLSYVGIERPFLRLKTRFAGAPQARIA